MSKVCEGIVPARSAAGSLLLMGKVQKLRPLLLHSHIRNSVWPLCVFCAALLFERGIDVLFLCFACAVGAAVVPHPPPHLLSAARLVLLLVGGAQRLQRVQLVSAPPVVYSECTRVKPEPESHQRDSQTNYIGPLFGFF